MLGLSGSKVLGLGLTAKVWAYVLLGTLALLLASFGAGYGFGHGAGEVKGVASKQKEVDRLKAAAAQHARDDQAATAKVNAENRAKERQHEQEIADLRAEFAAQQAAEKAADARTIADLRNGNQQLRFRVASCRAPGPGTLGTAPGGVDGQADAELAPETAAALFGIAADGDAAIREHNGLIDWANSAMKLCGVMPPKEK